MKRRPNTLCKVCGNPIYRRPSQIETGKVFCSSACNGKSQRIMKKCRICGKQYFGDGNTCSRSCSNTSRAGITYDGSRTRDRAHVGTILRNKIASMRGGVCERCGEKNYAILQIHHKHERYRGGKDDPKNLELLCPNCHMTHHLGFVLFRG